MRASSSSRRFVNENFAPGGLFDRNLSAQIRLIILIIWPAMTQKTRNLICDEMENLEFHGALTRGSDIIWLIEDVCADYRRISACCEFGMKNARMCIKRTARFKQEEAFNMQLMRMCEIRSSIWNINFFIPFLQNPVHAIGKILILKRDRYIRKSCQFQFSTSPHSWRISTDKLQCN